MHKSYVKLLLLIFGIIIIIIGLILMFYPVEKKVFKSFSMKDYYEAEVEYEKRIDYPFREVGIWIFAFGLTLIIMRIFYNKREEMREGRESYYKHQKKKSSKKRM